MIQSYGSVLVVNDVEINLAVAQELLESYKLKVDTAASGCEALEMIQSGRIYDIIFMDYMMPVMDGIETTHKIREYGYNGKVVVLTGNALEDSKKDKYKIFDGFLQNPIDTKKLEEILDSFVPIIKMSGVVKSSTDNSRIMRAFRRDSQKAIDCLYENITDDGKIVDIKSLTSAFHAMKTALANIGCQKESQLAYSLEQAGHASDSDFILQNAQTFADYLREIADLDAEAEDTKDYCETELEDSALVLGDLKAIQAACDDYDINAVETAFAVLMEKPLKNSTREFLEQMRDLIYSDSDFDAVFEKITEFISSNTA